MRAPNGCDPVCMPGSREPVMDGGPNPAPLDRRIPRPMMAGDQQDDAIASRDRSLETAIDCRPGGVEIHAVKIEHAVRLDIPASKLLVPAAIQRTQMMRFLRGTRRRTTRGTLEGPACRSLATLYRLRRPPSRFRE